MSSVSLEKKTVLAQVTMMYFLSLIFVGGFSSGGGAEVSAAPPVARLEAPEQAPAGEPVTLDASASSDPDGDPLTYTWDCGDDTPPFTTTSPRTTHRYTRVGTYTVRVTVDDGRDGMVSASAIISVVCPAPSFYELVQASPGSLWPPNHQLVLVNIIVGMTEPDDEQVPLTITGVTQDEPVHGLDEGNTGPDAMRQPGLAEGVLLRAERSEVGNGRVYEITFTAADGVGEACEGSVTVCVPHDRRSAPCIDDGQQYDSLLP
jgi:hypothetical protein